MERCSISLGNCKAKLQWGSYYFLPTRLAIIKKIKSVDTDGEESEPSIHCSLENVKWHSHFWKTVPQNMKYKSYHMVQEFYYSVYTRKKWKPMSTLELIHRSVHNSIIRNNKKVETIYVPINCWMDKQNVVDSHNGTEFSNKKEWSTNICYNIDEFLKHAKWKKP